jgi:Zn-dependent protease with chaperone function
MLGRIYEKAIHQLMPEKIKAKMWADLEQSVAKPFEKAFGQDSKVFESIRSSDDFKRLIQTLDDESLANISPQTEEVLAASAMDTLARKNIQANQVVFGTHTKLSKWMNTLAERLTTASNLPFKPQVTIFNSTELQAYSTGRGQVAISTGLLKILKSEAEVAGVIAHELSHGVHRDGVVGVIDSGIEKKLQDYLAHSPKGLGGKIKFFFKTIGLQGRFNKAQQQLSHQKEFRADLTGVSLMDKAGFNPNAYKIALSRMGKWEKKYEPKSFLVRDMGSDTHPDTLVRKQTVKNHIDSHPELQSTRNPHTGARGFQEKLDKHSKPDFLSNVLGYFKG